VSTPTPTPTTEPERPDYGTPTIPTDPGSETKWDGPAPTPDVPADPETPSA
jgi:hypothetical protein